MIIHLKGKQHFSSTFHSLAPKTTRSNTFGKLTQTRAPQHLSLADVSGHPSVPASAGDPLSPALQGADTCESVPRRSPCPRPGVGAPIPRSPQLLSVPPLCRGAHTLMQLTEKGQWPRKFVPGDVFICPSRSVFRAGNRFARMTNPGFQLPGAPSRCVIGETLLAAISLFLTGIWGPPLLPR